MSQGISYYALVKLLNAEDWQHSQQMMAGIERELLRVAPDNTLAQTTHPPSLGSALTHPHITLDFSEAQIELVTAPHDNFTDLTDSLEDVHAFTAQQLPDNEHMWLQSMPALLNPEDIQPARFGSSLSGHLKTVYRQGLANRYGKQMQVISGIHFNFSWKNVFWERLHNRVRDHRRLSVFVSENYLALLRNYSRLSWLLAYLMGSTPAIDQSFLKRLPKELSLFKNRTLIGPYATSLRMSRIGYVNSSRCTSSVNYNSLTDYLSSLYQAITTPCPGFEFIGLQNDDGSYRQLNTHLLQIENEHYALARPKQPVNPGERPFRALRERGVAYVEVRALDAQFDSPIGIHEDQMQFIRLFLMYCLLSPNPPIDKTEELEMAYNHQQAALYGRQPGLELQRKGESVALTDWAKQVFEQMTLLANTIDKHVPDAQYTTMLDRYARLLDHPEETPSARVLAALENEDMEFLDWAQKISRTHEETLKKRVIPKERQQQLEQQVKDSLSQQEHIEASETGDFESYLDVFNHSLKA